MGGETGADGSVEDSWHFGLMHQVRARMRNSCYWLRSREIAPASFIHLLAPFSPGLVGGQPPDSSAQLPPQHLNLG